jgi:hypothetical protein
MISEDIFNSFWFLKIGGNLSNPLLDMRIHDITVVADPNRRMPTALEP